MIEAKGTLVRIGDVLFKWRNYLFPVILVTLFVAFPPATTLGGSAQADTWRDALAIGVVLTGLFMRFMTIGWAYIKRGGVAKKVYADTLVTDGYFGLCRNPLYVGNLLIYTGVFLLHGDPVVMIAGPLLFVGIYICIVAAEEHFLRAKFGADYAAYCARVARWVPALSRLKTVTAGMNFRADRSLLKDYTTIANAAVSVIVIEVMEAWRSSDPTAFRHVGWIGLGCIVMIGLAVLAVRRIKVRSMRRAA